jgi:hypothetical protein
MGDWHRWDGPDLLLQLKLQTRASRDAFAGLQNGRQRICVTAAPVDGKANLHLVSWLAGQFGVSNSKVTIEAGRTSQLKRVRVATPARLLDIVKPTRTC